MTAVAVAGSGGLWWWRSLVGEIAAEEGEGEGGGGDPEMQSEIDTYLSEGHATFGISMLANSTENWEPATLKLIWSGFQVNIYKPGCAQIVEKFSEDLSIKIPCGISTQFDIRISDGYSYSFSTDTDVRKHDTIVLTMRKFQSKVLESARKKTIIGIHNQAIHG
ncbi:hypothetical protein Droror1_Dr00011421 [Drosera rotundifolia]